MKKHAVGKGYAKIAYFNCPHYQWGKPLKYFKAQGNIFITIRCNCGITDSLLLTEVKEVRRCPHKDPIQEVLF